MEVFKKHNDQMAELVGLEYAPGTLERFQTAYRHCLTGLRFSDFSTLKPDRSATGYVI
jgi:hypothetical protein